MILAAVNIAAHLLVGGFTHSYIDDLLAVPMLYCTVRLLYTEEIRFLPEIIFAVRTGIQFLIYLFRRTVGTVDSVNFSQIAREGLPYAKTALVCFAGMVGLECGRILLRIFRQTYDHQSRQRRRLMMAELFCIVLALGGVAGYFAWEDNAITVSHYTYESDKVSPALDGFTIAQVSDLHNKSFGEHSYFLIGKLKAAKPDMIVVTGDLVDYNRTDIDAALDFIAQAVQIAPLYYVTGNHDEALPLPQIYKLTQGIEQAGGVVLDSECAVISRRQGILWRGNNIGDFNEAAVTANAPDDVFNLIGLANVNLFGSKIEYITPHSSRLNILLAHQPQAVEHYVTEPVDLIFSGHAHGGQVRLPFFGPVYAPGQGFSPKYTEGVYDVGSASMVVSRGLGNSVFPIRINNRPELVIVELKQDSGFHLLP